MTAIEVPEFTNEYLKKRIRTRGKVLNKSKVVVEELCRIIDTELDVGDFAVLYYIRLMQYIQREVKEKRICCVGDGISQHLAALIYHVVTSQTSDDIVIAMLLKRVFDGVFRRLEG